MLTNDDKDKMEFDLQEIEMRLDFIDATLSAVRAESEIMLAKIQEFSQMIDGSNEDSH